ncbi:MAG: DUF2723 domain-containing protein [Mariprofundales bacterium]
MLGFSICAVILPWITNPVAGWRDGPEFIVSAWVLGISHPAGFPIYNALLWMSEQIPLANIAVRNHSMSAWLTLMASVCLYAAGMAFLRLLSPPVRGMSPLLAVICLVWLLLPAEIENAVQAEVYALHALFTFLISLLLFQFLRVKDTRLYVSAAFLAGLGAGNHMTLGALLFALMIAVGIRQQWSSAIRLAIAGILAGLAGLAVYAMLPVRAFINPVYNWGDPRNLTRFWHHVSDKKDASTHFSTLEGGSDKLDAWMQHLLVFSDWLSLIGLLLLVSGWLWLLWRHTRLASLCLLWCLFLLSFFIGWESGTVLTGMIGIMLLGILPIFLLLIKQWQRVGIMLSSILALCILVSSWQAGMKFFADRAMYLPRESVAKQFIALPYRATVLSSLDWFHLTNLQYLEGLRPDVTVIGLGEVLSPQYFKPLRATDIPLLQAPSIPIITEGAPSAEATKVYLTSLIGNNINNTTFFIDVKEDYNATFKDYMTKAFGFWGQHSIQRGKLDCQQIDLMLHQALREHTLEEYPASLRDKESARYLMPTIGGWLQLLTNPKFVCVDTAQYLVRWWILNMPINESPDAFYHDMAIVFLAKGYDNGAGIMFQNAYEVGKQIGVGHNFAVWLEQHDRQAEALVLYKKLFLEAGHLEDLQAMRRILQQGISLP